MMEFKSSIAKWCISSIMYLRNIKQKTTADQNVNRGRICFSAYAEPKRIKTTLGRCKTSEVHRTHIRARNAQAKFGERKTKKEERSHFQATSFVRISQRVWFWFFFFACSVLSCQSAKMPMHIFTYAASVNHMINTHSKKSLVDLLEKLFFFFRTKIRTDSLRLPQRSDICISLAFITNISLSLNKNETNLMIYPKPNRKKKISDTYIYIDFNHKVCYIKNKY